MLLVLLADVFFGATSLPPLDTYAMLHVTGMLDLLSYDSPLTVLDLTPETPS